jgi:transcriptional regulator with XRE-family HTH domain
MSDNHPLTPKQCAAARALIGMTQGDLLAAAGINSSRTLSNFEGGLIKPRAETLKKFRNALEAAGVVFIDSNGQGPGVRLREPGE